MKGNVCSEPQRQRRRRETRRLYQFVAITITDNATNLMQQYVRREITSTWRYYTKASSNRNIMEAVGFQAPKNDKMGNLVNLSGTAATQPSSLNFPDLPTEVPGYGCDA